MPPEVTPRDADAAIDKVFAALREGDRELTVEDLGALSDLDADGRARAMGHLTDLDPVARFAVLEQLGSATRATALLDFTPLFLTSLNDDDGTVRAEAASGLAACESPEAVAPLIRAALADEDEAVRSEAALALGPLALAAEFGRLSEANSEAVGEALQVIASDIREEPEVRATALASAGALSQPWVAELIYDAYDSDDPALRLGALQAMGRTADPQWLPTLFNAMQAADEDERLAAATAAGEISDEDAVPELVQLFEDESGDVVRTALNALGQIGGSEAGEHLRLMLTHPDTEMRAAAQEAVDAAVFMEDPLGMPPELRT